MSGPIGSALVVVPAYNAEKTLARLIDALLEHFERRLIIVIDDGSTDGTKSVADSKGVTVLHHANNRGKGAALATGFEFARTNTAVESILTIDADLQHRPEEVPSFFEAQRVTGADIVVGTRKRVGVNMPLARIISNTITSALVSARAGVKIRDSQCGFRLIKRKVVETIQLVSAGYEAETEFLIKAAKEGFRIEFVPIQTVYAGERSFMTHWDTTVKFIRVLFREY